MSDLNGFVVAAYVVIWVGLVGYAVRLHRVSREARRRLAEVSREGRSP